MSGKEYYEPKHFRKETTAGHKGYAFHFLSRPELNWGSELTRRGKETTEDEGSFYGWERGGVSGTNLLDDVGP